MPCLHFVLSYRCIEDSKRALIVCYGIKRVIENGDEGSHVIMHIAPVVIRTRLIQGLAYLL